MTVPSTRRSLPLLVLSATLLGMAPASAEDGVRFLDPLTDEPIEFEYRPDQEITPAVEKMHATGENAYLGEEQAILDGEATYKKLCQACHMPDGSGRIGPSLIDDQHKYERTGSQKGMFEIVYVGGAGAMQAFGRRIDQDEILKVLAYVETLKQARKAGSGAGRARARAVSGSRPD
ncbi:MAG TPA: cytochrome c [Geminicoccaceae bacterium]